VSDYHLLGLGNSSSVIRKVEVQRWGNELLFNCLYEPYNSRQPYQLIFSNTLDIRWNVHDTDRLEVPMVDFVGLIIGEENHKKPAIVTTEVFEISVLYESLSVRTASEFKQVIYHSPKTAQPE